MVTLATDDETARERRQLVIVRREQHARCGGLMQVFDAGPGDGEAVERRRAAADLVEDDQRAALSPD